MTIPVLYVMVQIVCLMVVHALEKVINEEVA